MRRQLGLGLAVVAALLGGWHGVAAGEEPQGELTYAMHTTIAPVWFDPADYTGIAVPAAPAGGGVWGWGRDGLGTGA